MNAPDYLSYTMEEFLADDKFISWVMQPDAELDNFWNEFLKQNPSKQNDIATAKTFIQNYHKQDTFFNEDKQDEVWRRIENSVNNTADKKSNVISLAPWLRWAAAVIMVCSCGLAFWYYSQKEIIRTAFGEIKTIELPDHSVVVLNGNSSLAYERSWGNNTREVWLDGEAFFKVKHLNKDSLHIKRNEKFIVHAKSVSVEVLGTTFNVQNRHNKINVALVTGKIKVSSGTVNSGIIMKPGDYVEYAANRINQKTQLEHPEKIVSWSKRQFSFNDAKLGDIITMLEDTYGYHITLADPKLREMKIEGGINVTGVKALLETVSTSLRVNIYQNNSNIIIN
ncbi:FecR family protein [Mucilaginibacter sp. KACC 22063]|uniref:FecR family protein n=1 Tax=Mucilaginibacter sp. KACC 22063 TaxID=3025666 RepID=UPI0023668A54|nr:FecR family protein [Mucilaginibacter sp. KACC 22063]WDF54186.1 FecR family protein [Mucilaginibacter sp. KACC 22063]